MKKNILFVCTGNICRSPMAEAVARHKIRLSGYEGLLSVDSAGTHAYHVGESADQRTLSVCRENDVDTTGLIARKIELADFDRFDLILGMDRGHIRHMLDLASPFYHSKIALMMEYAGQGEVDVPDPYYGGMDGFYEVYQMVDGAMDRAIEKILEK